MAGTILSGMKAIVEYCGKIGVGRTEATIIQAHQQSGLPMRKLGGIWVSDKVKIDEWLRGFVGGTTQAPPLSTRSRKRL